MHNSCIASRQRRFTYIHILTTYFLEILFPLLTPVDFSLSLISFNIPTLLYGILGGYSIDLVIVSHIVFLSVVLCLDCPPLFIHRTQMYPVSTGHYFQLPTSLNFSFFISIYLFQYLAHKITCLAKRHTDFYIRVNKLTLTSKLF